LLGEVALKNLDMALVIDTTADVLCQIAIPRETHAYDRCGFVVKGSESLAVARGNGLKQAA
jgi:hypothetical protein